LIIFSVYFDQFNENPGLWAGVLFSLIVVVVVVPFLDDDHVIAVVIATPMMIAIIVTILHSHAWYADSNILGANGTVFANNRNAHKCWADQ
jgi:hypothetical protein